VKGGIMASINKTKIAPTVTTYEGGKAVPFSPDVELERAVMACFLWEDGFYESGESISNRIIKLVSQIKDIDRVIEIGKKAKDEGIRHAPLLIGVALAYVYRNKDTNGKIKDYIYDVIRRADELSEILAIWKKINGDKLKPISKSVKKGVAKAFDKFNEYQFGKYKKTDKDISLRDAMFLTHPKPTQEKKELYKKIANNELATPDTWEVALSSGADKKATFERLMKEKSLGALAFLRNLRNMYESGVDEQLINRYGMEISLEKIFPFRFVAAWRAINNKTSRIPDFLYRIDETLSEYHLDGKTLIFIDVSGSMEDYLSAKSDITRMDAAATIGAIASKICESYDVVTFSDKCCCVSVGKDIYDNIKKIIHSQQHGGTYLWRSLKEWLQTSHKQYDRLIIITDEQVHDSYPREISLPRKGYIINVGVYQYGIDYPKDSPLVRVNGFSEGVLKYIINYEKRFC
jgi:hypothetical protein